MVWISLVLNGSSTFARKRRTTTSTTFVSVLNPMSHTCSAISARDTTSPAERTSFAIGRDIHRETGFAQSLGQESRRFLFVLDYENPHNQKNEFRSKSK